MKYFRIDGTLGMGDWKKAGLLLVGHGSSRVASSGEATHRLAAAIRERNLFAQVEACFWRQEPRVSLDLLDSKLIYVVPNFSGEGKHTRLLIPERLGLIGRLTQLPDRSVVYCDPVGSHPHMAMQLRRRAEELCRTEHLIPGQVSLLLIGHGSAGGGASQTPEAMAAALREMNIFAEVVVSYIEQEPRVADWPRQVTSKTVIAAPLLFSEGMHASEDLPPLFGMSATSGGPTLVEGHRVWLMGGIGRDPDVLEMILDQIRAAEASLGVQPPLHSTEQAVRAG